VEEAQSRTDFTPLKLKLSSKETKFCLLEIVIIAIIYSLIIKTYIVQAYYIPSSSMEPTLKIKDRILVNKFIYKLQNPRRKDIVVFLSPVKKYMNIIKRVIGIPGDILKLIKGELYLNNRKLKENYIFSGINYNFLYLTEKLQSIKKLMVPDNYYYVMGDNRARSMDSRYFGPVEKKLIKGKAFIIYWPIYRWRLLND